MRHGTVGETMKACVCIQYAMREEGGVCVVGNVREKRHTADECVRRRRDRVWQEKECEKRERWRREDERTRG